MRTALIGFAACLAALASPIASAQQAASIRGRVVAAENDRVLPRARLVVSVGGRSAYSVLADDRGRFTLPAVSDSVLVVGKAGYALQHVTPPPDGQESTIALSRSASISGRVTHPNGEDAVEVRVIAQRQEVPTGDLTPVKFETTTDDLGEYRLGGLPRGRYEVSALDSPEMMRLDLRAGDEIASIDFTVLGRERFAGPPRDTLSQGPLPGQRGTGAITGRVLSGSGRPLERVRVLALRAGLTPRGAPTDARGHFAIAELPAGTYTLQASRDGYVPVLYGQERAAQAGKQVLVHDDETASGMDIVLQRGTSVTGTIVDEHGEPLQGVSVRAMQLRYVSGRTAALNVGPRDRRTDDRGRYRLYGLLPGSYLVVATVEEPISGAPALGYAPVFHPGTTQPSEASAIIADLGRDVSAIDLVLKPTTVARVTASVRTSDGSPFTGLVLMMASQRSGGMAVEPQRPEQRPDGSFVFANVPPAEYVVQAMRAREQNRGMSEFGAQVITVADRDPTPLVITTLPGATLSGQMLYEGEGAASQPMVQSPTFMPLPTDFDRAPAVGGGTFSMSRGRDGLFTIAGLFGPTRFRLMTGQDNSYLKSFTIGGLDITDSPFDFGVGTQTITGAEVVISNAGGAISGHVTDAASAPVGNYSVVIFPTDRSKWFVTSRFLRLVRPTQDGSFEVTGLPPGEYWMAATDPIDGNDVSGDWLKSETLEQLSFRASRVTLAERQRVITVLRLIRK